MSEAGPTSNGVTIQLENVARWLENKCDPFHAARELRLLVEQMRSVETSGSVAQSVYESAVKGRNDFRSAYRQARELLQKFVAAWEGLPGHESMDRLCEIARNFGSSPDHRLVPCPKCGNRLIDAGFCDVCYSPEEPSDA